MRIYKPTRTACAECGILLTPENGYAKKGSSATGNVLFDSRCRKCDRNHRLPSRRRTYERANELRRKRYRSDSIARRKVWAANILRRTGCTAVRYEEMWAEQKGRCAICKRSLNEGRYGSQRACVDHDHKTGQVRALLCHRCNMIIGILETSEMIEASFRYLRSFEAAA